MPNPAIMVGFRLDPHHHRLLKARAERSDDSPGDAAKRMIIEKLNEPQTVNRLAEKLATLERELVELRRDLALAVKALLVYGGKTAESDAASWVSTNLNPR